MKKLFFVIALIILIIGCMNSCSKEEQEGFCGDNTCQKIESQRNLCPEDCKETEKPQQETKESEYNDEAYNHETFQCPAIETESGWTAKVQYEKESETTEMYKGTALIVENYKVTNPTSSAELDVTVYAPDDSKTYPAVILIPGGLGDKSDFEDRETSQHYASEGFIVLVFSPDGRGKSTGTENYNGYIQQDGLYELYRFLKEYERAESVGIASFSFGIALASGMIARYKPDITYYIEWEGPVDRHYITHICTEFWMAEQGTDCNDNEYWKQREALCFVEFFPDIPLIIVQRADDHAQPTAQHSADINNKAIQYLSWVRLNGPENSINTAYTIETLPVIKGKEFDTYIIEYMKELTS